jgi:hypothetical protein
VLCGVSCSGSTVSAVHAMVAKSFQSVVRVVEGSLLPALLTSVFQPQSAFPTSTASHSPQLRLQQVTDLRAVVELSLYLSEQAEQIALTPPPSAPSSRRGKKGRGGGEASQRAQSAAVMKRSVEMFRSSVVSALHPYDLIVHRVESTALGSHPRFELHTQFTDGAERGPHTDDATRTRITVSPLPALRLPSLDSLVAVVRNPGTAEADTVGRAASGCGVDSGNLYDEDEEDEEEEEGDSGSDSDTEDEDEVERVEEAGDSESVNSEDSDEDEDEDEDDEFDVSDDEADLSGLDTQTR